MLEEKKVLVWPEIEKRLNSFLKFPVFCRVDGRYQKWLDLHQKMVSDYPVRKGKYVRPSLVMLTAEAMGVKSDKAILTAAAMQMSEDWILGHDDVEDNSLERRGGPALHRIYGKELAINAGDGLQVLMWQALTDNLKMVGNEIGQKIIDEFVTMLSRTIFGQTVEIAWTQKNRLDLDEEDILLILESKTAYYTIAGPMRLGAILAGASQRQLEAIYEFGKPLGYCFQIRDDLLDLTSDFEGQKKQLGNDIYEGKRTIMLVDLLSKVKGKDLTKLKQILAKEGRNKTGSEVAWVILKMKDYGSLDHGQKLAAKFAGEARDIFESKLGFLEREPARSQLLAGVDFILNRGS